jgi:hypothetical protein
VRRPTSRRLFGGIAVAAAMAASIVATTGTAAQAAPFRGAGYVWSGNPADRNYSFNSSNLGFGTPINTVTWLSTGRYRVTYPNIGILGGTAHVTAYGSGSERCKVEGWGTNGNGGQDVTYRCTTVWGTLVDTLFSASYTNINSVYGGARLAYLWANDPYTPGPYTPSSTYQFNSSGGLSTITRSDVGTYTVEIPGAVSYGGHIQVTAYGSGNEYCKSAGWGTNGVSLLATVRCFSAGGQPADSRFTFTFADQINILGLGVFDGSSGNESTYVWAFDPYTASYSPVSSYAFGGGYPGLLASRSGVGTYGMRIGSAARYGNVQITAYGWDSEYCKVAYWTEASGIQTRCFNGSGVPADTLYDVAHVGPYIIG